LHTSFRHGDEPCAVPSRRSLSPTGRHDLRHDCGESALSRSVASGRQKDSLRDFFKTQLADCAPKTRNHYRDTLRQVFKFAVLHDLLPREHRLNEALLDERAHGAAPPILRPEQFERLLHGADDRLRPVLLIGGFAGARRAEIEPLSWSWEDVWRVPGYIELAASKTKTKARRLVPMQDCLAAWLAPYRQCTGPVWTGTMRQFQAATEKLRKAHGIEAHNVLRHSLLASCTSHSISRITRERKMKR
jgi:integrase